MMWSYANSFATCGNAPRLVWQRLAVDYFVLELDVCELVNHFCFVGASDNL